jgi:hypothetical protein
MRYKYDHQMPVFTDLQMREKVKIINDRYRKKYNDRALIEHQIKMSGSWIKSCFLLVLQQWHCRISGFPSQSFKYGGKLLLTITSSSKTLEQRSDDR